MKSELEKGAKKLEKMKKDIENRTDLKIEKRLKQSLKDLTACKTKSMMMIAVMTIFIMTSLNKYFSGKIVAKLPFTPFGFIKGLSHRGIEGDDFTDCSFIFLYILSNMSIRTSFQKICGFTTSRA